jgi:hypothetical protein
MNPWLFGLICFIVFFSVLYWAAMRRAPIGYEDAKGFHFGDEPFLTDKHFPPTHTPASSGGASPVADRPEHPRLAGEAPFHIARGGVNTGTALPLSARETSPVPQPSPGNNEHAGYGTAIRPAPLPLRPRPLTREQIRIKQEMLRKVLRRME